MGLGISIWNFAAQVFVFLVVILVLWKWALPTVNKFLDERSGQIQRGLENAETAKRQLAEAEKRVADMLEQARQRADEILAQAQKNIEQQIAQAKSELSRQVSDLAIMAAERVIGHSMNTEDNRKLVQEFVSQSRDIQC